MNTQPILPRDALHDDSAGYPELPVVDHYCGVETRMRKALALQAELGPVFDVTLDCEDGAPVGAEAQHVRMCAELAVSGDNRFGRVAVRVHPVDHPAFEADIDTLLSVAGDRLPFVMLPKPRHLADVQRAIALLDATAQRHGKGAGLPLHTLIETPGALQDAFAIAALPRIQSLSFGLLDFVSEHRGAIPLSALTMEGQFSHPLVRRAKIEISAACHASAKVPAHGVVTELQDRAAISAAATQASRELGFLRMWSIHPAQIKPIIEAFAPSTAEVDEAIEILLAAQAARWAPIRHRHGTQDRLHDRASYRYYWQTLQRAHRTGQPLPASAREALLGEAIAPG